jgi:hypothetical protein
MLMCLWLLVVAVADTSTVVAVVVRVEYLM